MSTRGFSTVLFAAALLAFLFPFGTAESSRGDEVSLTGVELATQSVDQRPAALAVLVAAATGLALGLANRRGGGLFASIGLVAVQLLGWLWVAFDDARVGIGLVLAASAFSGAGLLHLIARMRERRERGELVWHYPILALLVLLPTVAGALLAAYIAWFFELGPMTF